MNGAPDKIIAQRRRNLGSYGQCLAASVLMIAASLYGVFVSTRQAIDNRYSQDHAHISAEIISAEKIYHSKSYSVMALVKFSLAGEAGRVCKTTVDLGEDDLAVAGQVIKIVPRDGSCDDPIVSFRSPTTGFVLESLLLVAGIICFVTGVRGRAGLLDGRAEFRT